MAVVDRSAASVKRSDEDADPGMIGNQMITDIINAELVVADLTDLNQMRSTNLAFDTQPNARRSTLQRKGYRIEWHPRLATKRGRLQRAFAFSEGASSGTISVAVAVNGTSVGTFSLAGGSNAFRSAEFSVLGTSRRTT